MSDLTDQPQRIRARLTIFGVARLVGPLFVALFVVGPLVRESVCAAIVLFFVTWVLANAILRNVIRQLAKLAWRYGRWKGVRLEGGWYLLTRHSTPSELIQEITREFPSETTTTD